MASNLLSRFLPGNPSARSIYDDLRAYDEASQSDIEERAGLNVDEENLGYHDEQLGNAAAFDGEDSQISNETLTLQEVGQHRGLLAGIAGKGKATIHRSEWEAQSPRLLEEDGDDDVPASLLIEDLGPLNQDGQGGVSRKPHFDIPAEGRRAARAHWETAQTQQGLHSDNEVRAPPEPLRQQSGALIGSPQTKAMWKWVNVTNLDNFISDVYGYYTGAGIWCIVLDKIVDLLKLMFVAGFTTFLTQCVQWSKIPHSNTLSQVLVTQCTKNFSGMSNVAIWFLTLYVLYRTYDLLANLPRLLRIHDFYLHLLEVPDGDMQTISWQDVVVRIMALRDANPITVEKISPANRKWVLGSQSKERLDAHDICNRLMRKENFLIALFNKDILDFTLPLPFLRGRQLFSKTLEWNLQWCILDYIFNESGQVRQLVLKDTRRRDLSNGLRDRFVFAGFMNVICAPVIVVYLIIVYFLRYFNEYYKNPAALGTRQYTPLAEWKFREFNELPHLFHQRVNMSYPFASRYLEQFPKMKTVQATRFIAFVAGAIVSVLLVATVWDPEVFLGFEISRDRTALFYLGIFGPLWAIMNGSIPDENLVFDPEYALRNVIEYTHYQPAHWQDRLHSNEVKTEFASLYKLKVLIFLEEVLSIIITPFLLWFSLSKCSDQIIDFFREFTIHVDGVGYVCSFAVFDFKNGVGRKGEQGTTRTHADPRDDYYSTKHGKMAASYYGFLDNYMLNPKTGVPGHLPPGTRRHQHQQVFHPPPPFPGLMDTSNTKMSRMIPGERRPGNRAPDTGTITHRSRTPRFGAGNTSASPMPSTLLDPHHLPSSSGFGVRSVRRNSRSKYQVRTDITEEEDSGVGSSKRRSGLGSADGSPLQSTTGLEESRWETSPTRGLVPRTGTEGDADDEVEGKAGKGVLGLLYQFQKAQTDGRPGVNI